MAIVTCPECGQHPVSDRAASCPRCGCPMTAVNTPAASASPSPESGQQPPTIRQQREGKLVPLRAGFSESSEFPESSVVVSDLTKLAELVDLMQGWCEELTIQVTLENHHVDRLCRLTHLKSLEMYVSKLDDEALLRLSKLRTLCKLKFTVNEGRTSEAGWLQLARLSQLEFLEIPAIPFAPASYDFATGEHLKRQLRRLLPRTIVS